MSKSDEKGPRFVRYFGPVIEALTKLGGSGSPAEVRAAVAAILAVSEAEQSEQMASGLSRFDNQVAWARFYLTRAGLLDSSKRGIWSQCKRYQGPSRRRRYETSVARWRDAPTKESS